MNTVEMDRFLAGVEKRAFRMAQVALRDVEEALDVVQDAMFTLVRKYAHKPSSQWRPLFYRILQNRITDSHRRNAINRRLFFSPGKGSDDEFQTVDLIENIPGRASAAPDVRAELDGATQQLQASIVGLPRRQQQVFLLRALEGLNVSETARAMKCSEGSVKTHYSRALGKLREVLEDHWL
ncbi:MAG: RNA polymerase sigma factor [Gammaproteobacteria bacterium]|nr:RNA polymerase sigma factor [Gammaproteobacteria bacterium]